MTPFRKTYGRNRRILLPALSLLASSLLINGCLPLDKDFQPPEKRGSDTKIILVPENERGKTDRESAPSPQTPAK
jgi:hypothetical protein